MRIRPSKQVSFLKQANGMPESSQGPLQSTQGLPSQNISQAIPQGLLVPFPLLFIIIYVFVIIDDANIGFPNILGYITFNPNLPIFTSHPSIKRIVHFAIDRAIREVCSYTILYRMQIFVF